MTYFQVRIQTGAYKTRVRHHTAAYEIIDGKHTFTGPLFSEAELLEDEIQTMHRHIKIMSELVDSIATVVHEQPKLDLSKSMEIYERGIMQPQKPRDALPRGYTNSLGPG